MVMHVYTRFLQISLVGLIAVLFSACGMSPFSKDEAAKPVVAVEAVKPAPKPQPKEEDELQVMSPVKVVEAPKALELPVDHSSAAMQAPTRELPTDPNTFLIELVTKDKSHPNYGKGHAMGFQVNGVQGKDIIVKRGQTYTLQVRTDVKHDFYISKSNVGWGAAVFSEGVDKQFTYDGDVTFAPTKSTPDVLYYQCQNHQSMGGRIVVVNADADIAKVEAQLAKERQQASVPAVAVKAEAVSADKVKQKVSYAGMLLQFKGKGLAADQKSTIESLIAQAKKAQDAGELVKAFDLADQAVAMFTKAPDAGPSKEELEEMRGEYEGILASVGSFEEAHDVSMRNARKDKRKIVDYDRKEVAKLLAEADTLANQNKFKEAGQKARQAERLIATAMNEMLGSQTIVYELTFDTPKDEFEYETKRYESYLELIPVAIEVKKPSEGSMKLMQSYVDKGKFFHDKAHEAAKAGRWAEALVVIKDATQEVRRGLMLLGVNM